MLGAFWQQFTLSTLSLDQWRQASFLHRCLAPLRQWRQGSSLLPWGDGLGLLLVVLLYALAPYVSTSLIGLLLAAIAAFWLLLTLTDEASDGLTPIHLTVALYWSVMALATLLSPVRAAALTGLIKLSLNMMLFLLITRVARRPRPRNLLVLAYFLTVLPVSIYGLRQYLFGASALATWVDVNSSLANTTRVYSFLDNPNLLAGYLIPAVMLSAAAIFAWSGWPPKLLALTATGVNLICLVLTFSRGGWIGLVLGGLLLLGLILHYWSLRFSVLWRRWALPLLLGGSTAVVMLAVLSVGSLRDRALSLFVGREDSSNNFRLNVWHAVLQMIRDRPILGIGPGNEAFNHVYPLYQEARYTALSAYSIILEVMVEGGIFGFLAFAWMVFMVFQQGWQHLQRLRQHQHPQGYWLMAALAGMVGILGQGIADTVMYRPQISTLWWLMIALVTSYYPGSRGLTEES